MIKNIIENTLLYLISNWKNIMEVKVGFYTGCQVKLKKKLKLREVFSKYCYSKTKSKLSQI